jgi:hypothetical protein
MREIRPSGSEGGGTELNRSSLPLSIKALLCDAHRLPSKRRYATPKRWQVLHASRRPEGSPAFQGREEGCQEIPWRRVATP